MDYYIQSIRGEIMRYFMDSNFLLETPTAQRLYSVAKRLPIYDYYSHLNIDVLAEDKPYQDLGELLMCQDHYKWRAMASFGLDENLIRGTASSKEKYLAYAKILPNLIGNPLYHWTHMQLKNIFGIQTLLSEDTAEEIWNAAQSFIDSKQLSPLKLLKELNVAHVYTNADPYDNLQNFAKLQSLSAPKISPIFKANAILDIEYPSFLSNLAKLEVITGVNIHTMDDITDLISRRMDDFAAFDCKSYSLLLDYIPYVDYSFKKASRALADAKSGYLPQAKDISHYKTAIMLELAAKAKRMGWVAQYHISALRDVNSEILAKFGQNSGTDVINDKSFAAGLAGILDMQLAQDALPKTIIYTLNPQSNETVASIAGAFQGQVRGRIQFGTAWWFGDTRTGFERHLLKLASIGTLSTFIGMVTDSRSVLGYTRHEYFRRVLCNCIGKLVENGEYPPDEKRLKKMVSDICYHNAKDYFGEAF